MLRPRLLPKFFRGLVTKASAPIRRLINSARLERGRITPEERAYAATQWWGDDERWYPAGTPPRKNNRVSYLIDGEQFFASLEESILQSERYILIASWMMTPYFPLHRSEDIQREQASRLIDRLAEVGERGVRVRILIWDEARWARHPKKSVLRAAIKELKIKAPNADVRFIYDHSAHITHCIHEKVVSIDGKTAFLGGLDFATLEGDRWDTQKHPLRPGPNWHDVGVKIEGEAARDVDAHLRKRLDAASKKSKSPFDPIPSPLPVDSFTEVQEMQVVGTMPHGIYDFEKEGDFGIQHSYVHAIRQAKHFIYIENQFLWSRYIVDEMIAAIDRNRDHDFKIVILLPAKADTGKLDNDQHVEELRSYDPEEKVVSIYALYTSGAAAGFSPYRAVPVYLHAKVAVIDDEWFTIGSANLNDRSLLADVELNLCVKHPATARDLRLELWSEHLRMPKEKLAPLTPFQIVETIWKTQANLNKQIIEIGNTRLISGIHRYETGHMPGTWFVQRLEDIILEH